jgi:solute:Na+ symporter, SSS family
MQLAGIDYFIVILYLLGIVLLGLYFTKHSGSTNGYFLAGKSLPFWAIAMSIVASDIGVTEFIGLSGQGYRYGIVAANYDWIGSVPAMILAGLVFIPYYWRNGIFTIPEYLGRRYNGYVRAINATVWLVVIALGLGVTFWVAGGMLSNLVGWPVKTSIIITAVLIGIYTTAGGLSAVVMTEVVNLSIMIIGSIAILILGFWEIGGWHELSSRIAAYGPEYKNHFSLVLPLNSNTPYPWPGILFGLTLVLAPAYYIGNQTIVQRCLGAKNEWHAKSAMIAGAFLKLIIPVLVVFPGLIALALHPGIKDGDTVFSMLIKELLPPGLSGLVFVALIAALMSTMSSVLNSCSTIFTKDIYEKHIKKNASDGHYLIVGRICTVVILLLGVISSPLTQKFHGIYIYLQTLNSFIQGPIFAILLLGMFWSKTTQWGGLAGLIGGIILAACMYIFRASLFTIEEPFLYIAWWSFVGSVMITYVVSKFTKPYPIEMIRGLVYRQVHDDDELQQAIKTRMDQ